MGLVVSKGYTVTLGGQRYFDKALSGLILFAVLLYTYLITKNCPAILDQLGVVTIGAGAATAEIEIVYFIP